MRGWRAPLVWTLLAVNFLFAYFVLVNGVMWMDVYGDDPFRNPWAYGAMLGDGLAFVSLVLLTLAGVSSAAWARNACHPAFKAKRVAMRLLLAAHVVLLSCALISIVGIYLYFDWWQMPTYRSWLPTSIVTVTLTGAGLIAYTMQSGAVKKKSMLARYLPLVHQACVLWLLMICYYSTLGNIVDVTK